MHASENCTASHGIRNRYICMYIYMYNICTFESMYIFDNIYKAILYFMVGSYYLVSSIIMALYRIF